MHRTVLDLLHSAPHPATWQERDITADPSAAIAQRRAHTAALRPLFQQAGSILESMDRLIGRFRARPGGPELITAYTAARTIRDAGHGPAPEPVPIP